MSDIAQSPARPSRINQLIKSIGLLRESPVGMVGAALVLRGVEDARKAGKRILPLCPFAAAQFRRHPEWADVLEGR